MSNVVKVVVRAGTPVVIRVANGLQGPPGPPGPPGEGGGEGGGPVAWDDVTEKPSSFPPEAHGHTIADVTDLQTALDDKVDDDDPRLSDDRPPTAHGHAISDVTALEAALDALAAALDGLQPLDSDLTAIAALSTTAYGRALLTLANVEALRAELGLAALAYLNTVGADQIENGAVTVNKIAAGAVNNDKLASASVGVDQIQSNAVIGVKIADGAVSSAKLGNNAVTTAKIADGNVTLGKIANIANQRLLGNNSGSAAAPSEVSFSSTGLSVLQAANAAAARTAIGAVDNTHQNQTVGPSLHGLGSDVRVLGNRNASGEFVQRGTVCGSPTSSGITINRFSNLSVTFPAAFSSAPLVFVNATVGTLGQALSITTTGFTMRIFHSTSGSPLVCGQYLAIGS